MLQCKYGKDNLESKALCYVALLFRRMHISNILTQIDKYM